MAEYLKAYFYDQKKRELVYRLLLQLFLLFYIALVSRAANYLWVTLMAFWLTEPDLLKKIKAAFRNKVFLAVVALYIMHIISLLYTEDLYTGIKKLEIRISLLSFPLLLGTIALTRDTVFRILKTFIWGCAAVGFVGLINSILLYQKTQESVYLYSDNLLLLTGGQGIYFALYLNIAILFIFYLLMNKEVTGFGKKAVVTLLPFFVVLIFLLAGRASLVILVLLLSVIIITVIVKRRMYLAGYGLIVLLILGGILISSVFPKTLNRFKTLAYFHFDYSSQDVHHFNEESFENKWNGLTIRLALWSCTWDLIKKQPIQGTGIGDYMEELRKNYREKKFQLALDRDLSPHNQYLQVWLALGIAGLIALLLSLFYPSLHALQQRNYLFLFFILMVGLNMLTEEIFSVYRGVVFFSFFNSLLLFHPKHYPRDTY